MTSTPFARDTIIGPKWFNGLCFDLNGLLGNRRPRVAIGQLPGRAAPQSETRRRRFVSRRVPPSRRCRAHTPGPATVRWRTRPTPVTTPSMARGRSPRLLMHSMGCCATPAPPTERCVDGRKPLQSRHPSIGGAASGIAVWHTIVDGESGEARDGCGEPGRQSHTRHPTIGTGVTLLRICCGCSAQWPQLIPR